MPPYFGLLLLPAQSTPFHARSGGRQRKVSEPVRSPKEQREGERGCHRDAFADDRLLSIFSIGKPHCS